MGSLADQEVGLGILFHHGLANRGSLVNICWMMQRRWLCQNTGPKTVKTWKDISPVMIPVVLLKVI